MKAMQQARELDAAKSQARSQALKDNFNQLESQISRIETSLARKREDYALAEQEIETSKVTEQQSIQEIETYVYEKDTIDEELVVRRERNSEIIDALKDQEKDLKLAREKQSSIQGAKSKLTIEKERAQNAIDNLIAQCVEKYALDLCDLDVEFDEEFDSDKYGRQVSRLKSKIDGLGAINMMAIEEYEKLMERYEFLTGQKEEVIGSIMLLEEAISEIEETSREKFLATFHVINKNFQELFPVLFPTGEAKLELKEAEDGDVLNAGVEIMVRMPGKKPRSMNLYSGGEKALTAISLIFALLKTKPTPFCFLDEVDAPLDEANVGRYNLVLEKLSDRFQFIVITHNRRTMEVLDQLYGVTMQEGGVSTVIGVDMKKDIPEHLKKAFKQESA